MRKFKFSKYLILTFIIISIAKLTSAGSLEINISELESNKGFVSLVIYNNAKSFPGKTGYYKLYKIKISNKKSRLLIKNIPEGNYAIAMMHDANSNNKFDKNILGMPNEGFGFSNNPRVVFKEPAFNECQFTVGKTKKRLNIRMKYL